VKKSFLENGTKPNSGLICRSRCWAAIIMAAALGWNHGTMIWTTWSRGSITTRKYQHLMSCTTHRAFYILTMKLVWKHDAKFNAKVIIEDNAKESMRLNL